MQQLRETARRLRQVAIAAIFWLLATNAAWAQQDNDPQTGRKIYVAGYVLVLFCIALGLLITCRRGKRLDEPKMPEAEIDEQT